MIWCGPLRANFVSLLPICHRPNRQRWKILVNRIKCKNYIVATLYDFLNKLRLPNPRFLITLYFATLFCHISYHTCAMNFKISVILVLRAWGTHKALNKSKIIYFKNCSACDCHPYSIFLLASKPASCTLLPSNLGLS